MVEETSGSIARSMGELATLVLYFSVADCGTNGPFRDRAIAWGGEGVGKSDSES